jgi:serine phosphatase RsbU (regulator of sigma subunit)
MTYRDVLQPPFPPQRLPSIDRLDLSVLYRPLVKVSGDYCEVLPIDADRTLIVVGDISGKGPAAARIMGTVVGAIRGAGDRSDLDSLVRSVDAAIRDMGLDDKFTVMFLGIVDCSKGTLRYVNAAMPAPVAIGHGSSGPELRRLEPTMGIVGLVPFEEVPVAELSLQSGQVILIATDGLTEASNASGERLGDTELYERGLALATTSTAADFMSSVEALLGSFVGDRPLKDDLTILAIKVDGLEFDPGS